MNDNMSLQKFMKKHGRKIEREINSYVQGEGEERKTKRVKQVARKCE